MTADLVKAALQQVSDPERVHKMKRFYKTGPGGYAEKDQFMGVSVPQSRKISKEFSSLPFKEIELLITSSIHEHRLTALLILVIQFKKKEMQKDIFNFYISHMAYINNWDLVDTSAPHIIGAYLFEKEKDLLFQLAFSKSLWDRRIALLSTFYEIRKKKFITSMEIIQILLLDKEDLIHKAVGWALKEIGEKDLEILENFLKKNASHMARTSLRYAIEHLSEDKRKFYLKL